MEHGAPPSGRTGLQERSGAGDRIPGAKSLYPNSGVGLWARPPGLSEPTRRVDWLDPPPKAGVVDEPGWSAKRISRSDRGRVVHHALLNVIETTSPAVPWRCAASSRLGSSSGRRSTGGREASLRCRGRRYLEAAQVQRRVALPIAGGVVLVAGGHPVDELGPAAGPAATGLAPGQSGHQLGDILPGQPALAPQPALQSLEEVSPVPVIGREPIDLAACPGCGR